MVECRYCKTEIPGDSWTSSFICNKCDDKIEEEIYTAAKESKAPKKAIYWVDLFKKKYSEQHVLEAIWRIVADHRATFTNDWKLKVY